MSFDSPFEERKSLLGGVDTGAKSRDAPVLKSSQSPSTFTLFAILVCALCTGLNIHAYKSAAKPRLERYYDLGLLKRPNPFIGLERMQLPDEEPEHLLMYPHFLININKAEPNRVYTSDADRWAKIGGLTPPEDSFFKVDSKFSSIVEFRSIDYKMEKCQIAVSTSPASATNVTLGHGNNWVDVWNVTTRYPLDIKHLSWNSRPVRHNKIDRVLFTHGMNWTYDFGCPSDTIHSIEFSASDDATFVDWTQDHKGPTPGVVMYQRSSFLD